MLEEYEDIVEEWYFHHQDERLENFLCQTHVLKNSDQGESDNKPSGMDLAAQPFLLLSFLWQSKTHRLQQEQKKKL